jgi:hypothetical protein
MTKGLLYYSDCRADPAILQAVRTQLVRASGGLPIVSVTLAPVPGFGTNVTLPMARGRWTMFVQILTGLRLLDTDVVFHVEHDVLYPPEHFAFSPPRDDRYYYNRNTWKVDAETGHAVHYLCDQVSGLCANRALLVAHYQKRVERFREEYDHGCGYEPGAHRPPRGIDTVPIDRWWSEAPLIDIRHGRNLTKTRWSVEGFRNKQTCLGWVESNGVPFWGLTEGRFADFLKERAA